MEGNSWNRSRGLTAQPKICSINGNPFKNPGLIMTLAVMVVSFTIVAVVIYNE